MMTAIAAVARNRVIGNAGDLPWSIPEDWRRFKEVTWGSNLIMGRVTFEGIGDPLPGRTSIVISRRWPETADGLVAGHGDGSNAGAACRSRPDVVDELVAGHGGGSDASAACCRLPEAADALVTSTSSLEPCAAGAPLGRPDAPPAVIRVCSFEDALAACDPDRPVFVAGGAQIYALAWPMLTDLDITEVDQEPEGDAFFPEIDLASWQEVSRDCREGFAFVRYTRRTRDA